MFSPQAVLIRNKNTGLSNNNNNKSAELFKQRRKMCMCVRAMEMRCYRKILHISCKGHVTNEEVCVKIQQAIGPHEYPLAIVKRRKLKWCGHVSRSSGLANTILQAKLKGGRKHGRKKQRRVDNIQEWTGLQFAKSQRAWQKG